MRPKVFLSASIPLPNRDKRYFETADPIAIREAVKALALVSIENEIEIVFGGHPAITPMISRIFSQAGLSPRDHVFLYQSEFFLGQFPPSNDEFGSYVITPSVANSREQSLLLMRRKMICENKLNAAIFIGGMDGCIEEYELSAEARPSVHRLPIASTGGASLELYERFGGDERLANELTYQTLFRELIPLLK